MPKATIEVRAAARPPLARSAAAPGDSHPAFRCQPFSSLALPPL